ncbi:L,D-transpeptidase family protein [Geminicoccaceae bacterium 1502E]|nr:L,D-transpeptidase family protein [Geminicoccaceae bacterium 1502E]
MITRRTALGLGLAALAAPRFAARPARAEQARDDLIGAIGYYVTDGRTTLLDLALQRDLGILELSAANPGVDPWVPGADRLIVLPSAHLLPDAPREGIVINKSELRLYFFARDGSVETHAIGVGREGFSTPVGSTKIVRKTKDPTWYPTAETRRDRPELPGVVGPGPDNPLGDRALYLGWPTYLIHGTNKPYGVGRRVSRGCIRMYPASVQSLYEKVPQGAPVTVVEQPLKAGWHEGELYVEAHPDLGQLDELEETYAFTPRPGIMSAEDEALIRARAGEHVDRVDWETVRAELVARRGLPVRVTGATPALAGEAGALPDPPPALGGLY